MRTIVISSFLLGAGCVPVAWDSSAERADGDVASDCLLKESDTSSSEVVEVPTSDDGFDDGYGNDLWRLDTAPYETWAEVISSGPTRGLDDGIASPAIVVLPYATSDYPGNPEVTDALIKDELFYREYSVNDFLLETTYGLMGIREGHINAPQSVGLKWSAWGGLGHHEQFRRLVTGSDAPWSDYDLDGNKRLDRNEVMVVLMDFTGEWGGAKRDPNPVTVAFKGENFVLETSSIFFAAKAPGHPQSTTTPITPHLPAITHEFGHALFTYPDRYGQTLNPSGPFDAMNCCRYGQRLMHFSAYDKIKTGVVMPPVYEGNGTLQTVSLRPSEIYPDILVWTHPKVQGEYWIFENRQKGTSTYETGFPESGLAIWRVKVDGWGNQDLVQLIDKDTVSNPSMTVTPTAPSLFTNEPFFVLPDSSGEPRVSVSNVRKEGDRMWFDVQ